MAQMARDSVADKLVVVIDDDALVLEAMGGLLRSWGLQVVAAASERAALAELAKLGQRPDLIICDYRLSEGNIGTEAIAHLRKAFEIPAFLITSDAAPQRLVEARASDALLLHKPVSPAILRAVLSEILKIEDTAGEDD
jgi:CheY-like chemotaxis protein